MVFEHIEKLKREYTDKFVVVDESRPELRRFRGMTGTVRTVNMSGRALVEFDGRNNIGWFDIDVDFLKVVDAPVQSAETKPARGTDKPAAKAPPKKPQAASPPEKAGGKSAGGMSVSDILAAARGGKAEAPAKPAPAKSGGGSPSVADILAAARRGDAGGGAPAASPAAAESQEGQSLVDLRSQLESARRPKSPPAAAPTKTAGGGGGKDAKSMSVAEMLAAARGELTGGGQAAPANPPAPKPQAEQAVTSPEPTHDVAETPPADKAAATGVESVPEILAYCRKADGGS